MEWRQARITIGHCTDETTILKRLVAPNAGKALSRIGWRVPEFQAPEPAQAIHGGDGDVPADDL